jgi:hypothetical protein
MAAAGLVQELAEMLAAVVGVSYRLVPQVSAHKLHPVNRILCHLMIQEPELFFIKDQLQILLPLAIAMLCIMVLVGLMYKSVSWRVFQFGAAEAAEQTL